MYSYIINHNVCNMQMISLSSLLNSLYKSIYLETVECSKAWNDPGSGSGSDSAPGICRAGSSGPRPRSFGSRLRPRPFLYNSMGRHRPRPRVFCRPRPQSFGGLIFGPGPGFFGVVPCSRMQTYRMSNYINVQAPRSTD
jgi:hypothetical protein